MSQHLKFENHSNTEFSNSSNKVKVTDLLLRLSKERKTTKKRNLAIGIVAVSAATFFGIILTV